jgi:hypothetical protein
MFSIQGLLTCQSELPMTYKDLRRAERYQIYALLKAGHDQTQIAKLLDRHKLNSQPFIVPHAVWSGYTQSWTAAPYIRSYIEQQAPQMPAALTRCFDPQSQSFN